MAAGKNFKVVSTLAGPFHKGDVISEEHIKAANHDVEHWRSIGAIEATDAPINAAKVAERVGAVAAVGKAPEAVAPQIELLDQIVDRLDRLGPMLGRVIELLTPNKVIPMEPAELVVDTAVPDRLDKVIELLGELAAKPKAAETAPVGAEKSTAEPGAAKPKGK